MNRFEQAYRKFLGAVSKLDHEAQFAIVGGFLIIVYIVQKLKKNRRQNSQQYKQLREMASLLVNQDRQKRDGIIWFFNLFVFLFFFTLLSYALIYISEQFSVKPILKQLSFLKISYSILSLYFKIALAIELIICIALYKLVHYYNNRIPKIMTDSKAQEQRDLQEKEKEKQNLGTKTMNDSDLQKSMASKKCD